MPVNYDHLYPDVKSLKEKARKRMPGFAYDYLVGGCDEGIGLVENRRAIQNVKLQSEYLKPFSGSSLEVELFGHKYSAPFGIAPIGLQGLMWPNAPEILAKAALNLNVPYVLSTVSSSSLERIAEVSEGAAWFQLYNPTDSKIRKDLIKRIKIAGYSVLMVTVDVPTFGYRSRDIKNGLSMPPKMSLNNIIQMASKPRWLLETALAGKPEMQTLKPYMAKGMPTDQLADFMNKTVMGRVDFEALKHIRDLWSGPMIIKGLMHENDVQKAIRLGADGVVISNHGARQLDCGTAPILPLQIIAEKYGGQLKIMMDSGLRSGTNIAAVLASGADFTFLGRAFVYGVAALGEKGGAHTINILRNQLQQVVEQLRCHKIADLSRHLVK